MKNQIINNVVKFAVRPQTVAENIFI